MHSYKVKLTKLALTVLAGASVCAFLMPAGLASAANPLKVEGSTTVQPIAEASQGEFEGMYPGTDVQVAGGGSGAGQTKILADQIDVGMMSSVPSSTAYTKCDVHIVAKDAVCIIVKDSAEMNFTDSISKAQLFYIYQREGAITTTTWAMVDMVDGTNDGWPNDPVVPRARIIGSGTRASFNLLVLGTEKETSPEVIKEVTTITATGQDRLAGNPDVVDAIKANNYHIGYVGLGFTGETGIKVLKVDGVMPSEATILNATYGLSRNLYMLTLKAEHEQTYNLRALDYVNFIMSPAGQNYIEAEGFVKIQSTQPYWDLDGSHQCNILDVSMVGTPGVWMTSGAPGWRVEDVDNNGSINILDVSVLGSHWLWNW